MAKVIQIAGLTQEGLEGVHPPGCGIAILTDHALAYIETESEVPRG